jgi:hypothetical protein
MHQVHMKFVIQQNQYVVKHDMQPVLGGSAISVCYQISTCTKRDLVVGTPDSLGLVALQDTTITLPSSI